MDGETNGSQEATQGAQDTSQQQGQEQQETQQGQSQVGGDATDYEKQIAERDEKIVSLEAQVTEAAKNAETAEQLRSEIAELKAQGESVCAMAHMRATGSTSSCSSRARAT